MLSLINKQFEFNKTLLELEHVVEVYASPNFSMSHEAAEFVLLCKLPINVPKSLFEISALFELDVKVYVVYDAYSALLKDKRIIWREGVWYV